ncbi:hypothetical protein FRACYDRAFT_239594 [Fragilariopsis cylindrus CCMP1102]|uniref:Uncharacterized protein n=1 Tax=Fragilariopsis cylindrus CCMP1102 TaxID=635003 RepID=A0A1E7FFR6_9STRA|nr:hypothetical protein FRACYDRAFT_239594 [Fragilariopsis cylindrus CCMP1102]|eukprot:OEU16997.1 hypothetical protein FRACYDRAFT_239594 [Fragilariopsis cylindrus CCMP1102]
MSKVVQWKPASDDAALVARAINSGDIDRSKAQYDNFFDHTPAGQELSHKYHKHTEKGERNLRRNFLALYDKIVLWKANKPNQRTGNLVKFAKPFLKKGNFEPRPEIVGDIPAEHLEDGFLPGRDAIYEEVIIEERANQQQQQQQQEEEEEEGGNDYDSLTVGGDQLEDEEEEEEEEEEIEEEELHTPTRHIDEIMEDLAKADFIKGQCPVAFEILDPFVGILDVDDPDYTDNVHSRDCCIVRTNIPSGVNLSSYQVEVGPNGKEIIFTMTLIKSRLEAEYTLGKGLGSVPGVINAMEKPLTKRNSTLRRASQRKGSQSEEVKTYKLKVPKAIEKSPRNPYNKWGRVMKGATGVVVELPRARSTLNYAFFFFKEDESIVPPTAMAGGVLGYEINNDDNDLNPTEQIMRQAEATIQFDRRRQKKKKNKVRSPSPVASITKSIRSMSIAAGNKKDDLDSYFTDESYHSEFSDDASDIDDSTIETETTRPSVHAANLLRISRVRRMQMQAPAIKTVTVPGLAGLNSIVSINNGMLGIQLLIRVL